MLNKRINIKNSIIVILAIAVLLNCIVPIIHASAYSVFYADDYSFALFEGTPIGNVIRNYKTWQGTYSGLYFVYAFEPLLHGGLSTLRNTMVITNILLFIALYAAAFAFARRIECDNSYVVSAVVATLFVYIFTSYQFYNEIFTWFTGMAIYGLPLISGLFALTYMLFDNKRNVISSIIICLLLIIGVGGNQMICGFICYLMLSMVVYAVIEKKPLKLTLIYFAVAVLFSAVNAFCPGNFARHGQIDSTGLHPVQAIRFTASVCFNRIHEILTNSDLIIVMMVVIIVAIVFDVRKMLSIGYYWFSIVLLLLPFVTCFPICLGTSSSYMPSRAYFGIDLSIYFVSMNVSIFIGALMNKYIREMKSNSIVKVACLVLLVMAFGLACADNYKYEDSVYYSINKQFDNGDYQNYYAQIKTMTGILENAERGSDLVLTGEDVPYPIDYLLPFWISNDQNHWINIGVSDFYGLNSLRQE